jgi:predicted ATP-grasp superfamily ATP-dependent carboligase
MMRVFVYEHLSASSAPDSDAELLAAGRAMRDAVAIDLLGADDCAVSVASSIAHDVPPGVFAVRPAIGQTAGEFVAAQEAIHDRVWVIAPESDGVLASLHRAVGSARWVGCDAATIDIAASKRATLERVSARGVSTPLAFETDVPGRRWVVKPDDGAGALDTRVHATLDAARADWFTRTGSRATLEAWVEGEPLSLSLMCRVDRVELLSVNRQRIGRDASGLLSFDGVDIAAWPINDARGALLADWAHRVVRALPGLRGFVGIDLVWHAQRGPVLIEINPRVTMAYVGLSKALGRNLASTALAAHEREPAHA